MNHEITIKKPPSLKQPPGSDAMSVASGSSESSVTSAGGLVGKTLGRLGPAGARTELPEIYGEFMANL